MKRLVIILVTMILVGSMAGSGVAATIQNLAWPSDTTTAIKPLMLPFGYVYPRANPRRSRYMIYFVDAGIDIAAPAGSNVYAAEAGTVKAVILPDPVMNPMGLVIIEHTDVTGGTYTTSYSGVITTFLTVDLPVNKGEIIGTVQDFGTATAGLVTELHFGVRNAPYDNSMLAGTRSLPTTAVVSWGLPAFPEKYVDPIKVFLP